jgi:hypothetical protein
VLTSALEFASSAQLVIGEPQMRRLAALNLLGKLPSLLFPAGEK